MNKILKHSLLSSTSLATVAAPVVALVSCGSSNASGGGAKVSFSLPDISQAQTIELFKSGGLPDLKSWLTAHQTDYPLASNLAEVKKLTANDLQRARRVHFDDKGLSAAELAEIKHRQNIISEIDTALLHYSFDQNTTGKLSELQQWVSDQAIASFTPSDGRGPWRTDEKAGSKVYHWKELKYRKSTSLSGLDLVGSEIEGDGKKELLSFNTYSSPKKGDRFFDPNIVSGNSFVNEFFSATSFSIFRTKVYGENVYTTDTSTGEHTWTSVPEERDEIFKGVDVYVGADTASTTVVSASQNGIVELDDLATAASQTGNKVVQFKTSSTPVNYAKVDDSDALVDTTTTFRARDLFLGFARSLYASKDFRESGEINGVDVNSYIAKFTDAQKQTWFDQFENEKSEAALDNANLYLFDLYGVDVLETLKANLEGTLNNNVFNLVFKDGGINPTALQLFQDNSFFSPFPASKLVGTNDASLDATKLAVTTYGTPYSGSGPNLSYRNVYSLAPFLITSASATAGEKRTILQNGFYVDSAWVNSPTSIKRYDIQLETENADANAFIQQRLQGFKNAKQTGEYLLNTKVYQSNAALNEVKDYVDYRKPSRLGKLTDALSWNFYGFDNVEWNNDGREIFWGSEQSDSIKNSPDALNEFFNGDGAKARAAIDSAINWYTYAQTLFPGQSRENFGGFVLEDELKISSIDEALAKPSFFASTDDLKKIYRDNINDAAKAWTAPTVANAAKTLDELATSVGATAENPAQIPIFSYEFKKTLDSQPIIDARTIALSRLNALTPKVRFVDNAYPSWDDYVSKVQADKNTPVHLVSSFNPDYKGAGTLLQQYLCSYGASFGQVSVIRAALETPDAP